MSLTVVIVNWNSGTLLRDCLNALHRQTLAPDLVLVVDNASADDSAACAASLPGVTLLQMPANLGFAAGNNRAFSACDTDYLVLLNPDAFPEPDWLERLVAAAAAHPEVAAFGSRQLVHGRADTLDGIGDTYHLSGLIWRSRHGKRQREVDLDQREIFSPCAAAALYRRQALMDVSGFDEDFFCYAEDVDLGFRMRLRGYKAMYVPDAVVHHAGGGTTGGQHSDFSVYQGHRNLVWTYVKNMPGVLFWPLLPVHIVLNLVTIGWFSLRGRGSLILRAKWDALKGLPQMWRKRRSIQSRRIIGGSEIWQILDKRLYWES